jgi:hypothetical protein
MTPGLQFFNFPGDDDGKDIKLEFEKRITEAEILLTHGEKEDIIAEAEVIFEFMVEMVGELDKVMGTDEEDLEAAKKATAPKISRDSYFPTQERLEKKARTPSEVLGKDDSTLLNLLVTSPTAKIVGGTAADTEKVSDGQCEKDLQHPHKCNHVSFDPALGKDPEGSNSVRSTARTTILSAVAVAVVFILWYL